MPDRRNCRVQTGIDIVADRKRREIGCQLAIPHQFTEVELALSQGLRVAESAMSDLELELAVGVEAVGDLDFDKDYRKFYGYKGCDNGAMYANTLFDCKKYLTE